jgi:hypothetical protein
MMGRSGCSVVALVLGVFERCSGSNASPRSDSAEEAVSQGDTSEPVLPDEPQADR